MLVTVADDKPQVVTSGQELRLAQADIFKEEGKAEKEKPDETGEPGKTDETGKPDETASTGGMSTITKVVLGGLAIGGIALAAGGGGGGDAPASPTGFQ